MIGPLHQARVQFASIVTQTVMRNSAVYGKSSIIRKRNKISRKKEKSSKELEEVAFTLLE
jgi:hypothetical protein